ncbi:hypothetical protein [Shewanella aestuarii]|uniref:Uncharacterized protein n=1 Tax=Shewanella aestuarii TaxID=1028752 RepID=A0A6G9QPK5_9GAMM|nr:hypothetical protein [Shewanella aestuarii]QIR16524.1 hypothetical protein HBH39_18785 [Shewanella aestuarii]
MKLALFDESDHTKPFWLIDSESISRGQTVANIKESILFTNLSAVDAILLQSRLEDSEVLSTDFFDDDICTLYYELTGKSLDLTDLTDMSYLFKVILNAHQKLTASQCSANDKHEEIEPKLSITKYSKNYFSDECKGAISKTLRFTNAEVSHLLSEIEFDAGRFKKQDINSLPSFRSFDNEIAGYYTDPTKYYYAKVQLTERLDHLNVYFQFNRNMQAIVPKSLLLTMAELVKSEIRILELYEYQKSAHEQQDYLPAKLEMKSMIGWMSTGIINRMFCRALAVRRCASSVFYHDMMRTMTTIRAEKLRNAGIKISSIGPFEINCSVKKGEMELLSQRAYEVGLYVAR